MERRRRCSIVLAGLALLLTGLVGACVSQQPTEYTDPSQGIEIGIGEQFIIALESNPTTGYEWEVDFDESLLELARSDFTPAKTGLTGAGGEQTFTFEGLKAGKTEVTLTYKRQWEQDFADQKVFVVSIK